jgi:hypothetical protein
MNTMATMQTILSFVFVVFIVLIVIRPEAASSVALEPTCRCGE